jgi:hypothetical protein
MATTSRREEWSDDHRVSPLPPYNQSLRPPAPPPPDDDPLFSITPIMQWLGFARRSVGRHRNEAVLLLVGAILLAGLALLASTPQYTTSMTILLRAEGVGAETRSGELDPVGRGAAGVILRQDNLDRIIDELGLIDQEVAQPFFGRIRTSIFETVFGSPSADNERKVLRTKLRNSILIEPSQYLEEIYVTVTWSDPQVAADIANLTFTIFFEDRQVAEIRPEEESVRLLEESVAEAQVRVDDIREDLGLSDIDGAPPGSVLAAETDALESLRSGLRDARLELQRARESLKFKYSQNETALVPEGPVSGNLINYVLFLFTVTFLVVGGCVVLDLRKKRVVEAWQLERLDVPILATIHTGR